MSDWNFFDSVKNKKQKLIKKGWNKTPPKTTTNTKTTTRIKTEKIPKVQFLRKVLPKPESPARPCFYFRYLENPLFMLIRSYIL